MSEERRPAAPTPDVAEAARVMALVRARLDLAPPDSAARIGRFTVLDRLGHGAMGIVYAVYDERLDRRVALKLLAWADTERERRRIEREARAMAKLDHPNVVSVFEVGEHDGRSFIVMEHVAGVTLQTWQRTTPRSIAEVLDAYLQAARGLAAAHSAGIVHRDFKPENVVVDDTGRVRVLDFGLAYDQGGELSSTYANDDACPPTDRTPTSTLGGMIGTPAYMSAEQFAGGVVDHRADQFAFCVALWEALTGERPFAGMTCRQIAEAVRTGAIRPPTRRTRLPAWLRPVLERGLHPNREERWPTMHELITALERGRREPRGRRALATGTAALAIAAGAWLVWPRVSDGCVDAASHFDSAWTPARREALRASLADTQAPFAATASVKVDALLADYADAWIAGYRDACEAHLRAAQSDELYGRRVRCLHERRRRFDALVDVLEVADAVVLESAPLLAAGLPRIESCADATFVSADALPPEDPATAAAVDELRDELAHVLALEDAGRYAEAKPLAQAVVERAEALDHPPILLDALNRLAGVHIELGEYHLGRRVARRGFVIAELSADRSAAANHSLLGILASNSNDYEEALMHHRRALAIHTSIQPGESDDVARIYQNIGNVLTNQRELAEARRLFETALAIRTRIWGGHHPLVADNHATLARLLTQEGDHETAIVEFRKAIAIAAAALGDDHPSVTAWRSDIAMALVELGRHGEALDEARAALAAAMRSPSNNARVVLALNVTIASAEARLDDDRRDAERYEAALAHDLQRHGEAHLEVALARNELAENLYYDGLHARAADESRRSLAIGLRVAGEHHAVVAAARANLGLALAGQGRLEEAEAELRRALASATGAFGASHPTTAVHRTHLAGVLHAASRDVEALALLDPASGVDVDDPGYLERIAFTALVARALGFSATADAAHQRLRRLAAADPLRSGLSTILALLAAVLGPPSERATDSVLVERHRLAQLGRWPFVAAADRWLATPRN